MKTYPLVIEDAFHQAIKHTAEIRGESIKQFIMKSIKAGLSTGDYIKLNESLQQDLKNKDQIDFSEISSVEELFN